jgi:tetratricopeptide (TPR) repeat protein
MHDLYRVAARACLLSSLMLGACMSPAAPNAWKASEDPLNHLGAHQRTVTTRSADARAWFDKGLLLTFAFNHDEAVRCYGRALEADPGMAIAWWGIAYASGPHINNPALDDAHAKIAWDALQKARQLAATASPCERALIKALESRYAMPNPADRRALDVAYADAMRAAWREHPDDADIGALCAEAVMDLAPWNQWEKDGQMRPGTEEVVAILSRVLAIDPQHPLAHHLTIHAWEASRAPERALASADALVELVPGAGHLVHMPAHIYARVGRWHDSALSNERAAAVDAAYFHTHGPQGFYNIYRAHNNHFLAWDCMMEGRSADAIRAARAMIADMPAEFIASSAAMVDSYLAIELEALMRFGRWDEILRAPMPPANLPQWRAYWRFARGVSLAALGRVAEARVEERAYFEAVAALPTDAVWGLNPASNLFGVATRVLAGEIAAADARPADAIRALSEAAEAEDALAYDEPYDWMIPARHALGAVLLREQRWRDAERVYREDLERYPENGWSLWGLARALREQGRREESAEMLARFERAWAHADITLATSCLCIPRP